MKINESIIKQILDEFAARNPNMNFESDAARQTLAEYIDMELMLNEDSQPAV